MTAEPIDPAAEHERLLRSELRRYLEESIDEEILLKALERPVVVHALDGGAEQMLRRYINRYVLPVVFLVAGVAAFFGWQVRDTVKDALGSIEENRREIDAHVREASTHLNESRVTAESAAERLKMIRAEIEDVNAVRRLFEQHLTTIRIQASDVDRRKISVENAIEALGAREREVRSQLTNAEDQAKRATVHQAAIADSVKKAEAAVASANDNAGVARKLAEDTRQQIERTATAATQAEDSAKRAKAASAEVESLTTKTDKLLSVGLLEVAMLRSNSSSTVFNLINIANPSAPEFALQFLTKDIRSKGFRLEYRVNGVAYYEQMPAVGDTLPHIFNIQGTSGQYQGYIDLIYSFRTAPDFISLRVKPAPRPARAASG